MFTIRLDFRLSPDSPTTLSELYRAGVDMSVWAEANGAYAAVLSEHHGSADGYLPSPLVIASAIAARTHSLSVNVAALLLLMYDPVKLAEDIAVLDHLSGGRVSYTIGLGYRDAEYAMFGVDPKQRASLIEEHIDVLRRALAGERFEWRGRTVHVTPRPINPQGPVLMYGGGTLAAARRAARFGMPFLPSDYDERLVEAYDDEARRVGNPPGLTMMAPADAPSSLFVADDVDRAWDALGPYLLHDAQAYAEWLGADSTARTYSGAKDVAALRAENGSYRIVTPPEAVEMIRSFGSLGLQPLCGGIPPELAWESLRAIETSVLPAFAPGS